MAELHEGILDTIRGRVLRGLQAGTLQEGDRLPSARHLVAEFEVDHRLILAAYRQLEAERLVEMRPRGGVYVATRGVGTSGVPALPEEWIVDMLAAGVTRELPVPELHEWLRRCTETLRLRAIVVASTSDQMAGLCRELRDDFGLEAAGFLPHEIEHGESRPLALRRADIIVTTEAHAAHVRRLGEELSKPVTVIDVRPDLVLGEWTLLLRRPVYAIVATEQFRDSLRRFFADAPDADNLQVLVFGQDDVSTIPDGAPTYVTQSVREQLGATHIPGRVLPAARTIAARSAREILAFVVHANIEAMSHRGP